MASKRFLKIAGQVDKAATYSLENAVEFLKGMDGAKFDESVEISASLNIDSKKGDQALRGTVTLPHGTGKKRRVLAFCRGEKEIQAREAGADVVGSADLIEKVQGGWLEFDVVVATPDMMRDVSRLGKILGPRGLMPNPRVGTVTDDIAKAVGELKRGKVEFKADKLANMHLVIGRRSFESQKLLENGRTALKAVVRAKPSSVKGRLIRQLTLSSTMGPGIPLSREGLEDEPAKSG